MPIRPASTLLCVWCIFVGKCMNAKWKDPNPFDPNSMKKDLKCKNDNECSDDQYCNGEKNCLSGARCTNGMCNCPPGRYGWRCQYATCEDYSFCKNDGDCMIISNRHECACPHNTTGRQCEKIICDEHTCNGACNQLGDCICPKSREITLADGSKGCKADCSIENPCKHDSTCKVIEGKYSCECSSSFHGPRCENLVCEPKSCINGVCMDGECICFPGYHGDRCQQASCEGYLGCFDKGTCSDQNNVLRCICDERKYAGTYCEFQCSKECSPNSKCGFDDKCYCNEGFFGDDCSTHKMHAAMTQSVMHMVFSVLISLFTLLIYKKFFIYNRRYTFRNFEYAS